jgi:hypothetical protein
MGDVEQTLRTVAAKVREVVRLISTDNANKDVCIAKVETCLSHLDGVRGSIVQDSHVDNMDATLRALRNELLAVDDAAPRIVDNESSYKAPRPLSGS